MKRGDFVEIPEEMLTQREGRPEPMPYAVPYYDHKWSIHPDRMRVSFKDGSSAVYAIITEQPHPLVIKNIEIINQTEKNIKQGYVNRPERRWRKK